MSEIRYLNPFATGGWRAGPDGARAFVVEGRRAPGLPLARDQLWVIALMVACEGIPLTFEDLVARADDLAPAGPQRDALLAGFWQALCRPLPPEPAINLWERHGWKLALDAYASMTEPVPHSLAGILCGEPDRDGRTIPVPDAAMVEAMGRRRTCRVFDGSAMPVEVLERVLAALDLPSLTPANLVCHILTFRVAGLSDGVYRHVAGSCELVRRVAGSMLQQETVRMLIGQPYVVGSAVGILLSGELEPVIATARHPSAFPAWLIAAGAATQRLILAAEALGFASFLSAAIDERRAAALTGSRLYPAHFVAHGVPVS